MSFKVQKSKHFTVEGVLKHISETGNNLQVLIVDRISHVVGDSVHIGPTWDEHPLRIYCMTILVQA